MKDPPEQRNCNGGLDKSDDDFLEVHELKRDFQRSTDVRIVCDVALEESSRM